MSFIVMSVLGMIRFILKWIWWLWVGWLSFWIVLFKWWILFSLFLVLLILRLLLCEFISGVSKFGWLWMWFSLKVILFWCGCEMWVSMYNFVVDVGWNLEVTMVCNMLSLWLWMIWCCWWVVIIGCLWVCLLMKKILLFCRDFEWIFFWKDFDVILRLFGMIELIKWWCVLMMRYVLYWGFWLLRWLRMCFVLFNSLWMWLCIICFFWIWLRSWLNVLSGVFLFGWWSMFKIVMKCLVLCGIDCWLWVLICVLRKLMLIFISSCIINWLLWMIWWWWMDWVIGLVVCSLITMRILCVIWIFELFSCLWWCLIVFGCGCWWLICWIRGWW